jgi:ubiquinone/menaquinone biosynthesis C-methylase UbiE
MEHYEETHKTWNSVAQRYEDAFMDLDIYNDSYDRFCELLPNDEAAILEIGCGPGNITKHLLDRHPLFDILATDVAPNMITLVQKNVPKARSQQLDARNLNTISEKFHGMMCGFTLPYLSRLDTIQLIKDAHTLLQPNGMLYLSFVSGNDTDSGFIAGSTGERTYFYYHDTAVLKNELTSQGFQIVEHFEVAYKRSEEVTEMHTILLAQK